MLPPCSLFIYLYWSRITSIRLDQTKSVHLGSNASETSGFIPALKPLKVGAGLGQTLLNWKKWVSDFATLTGSEDKNQQIRM